MTNLSQFAWNFSSFKMQSPLSWEPSQPRENWSSRLITWESGRLAGEEGHGRRKLVGDEVGGEVVELMSGADMLYVRCLWDIKSR